MRAQWQMDAEADAETLRMVERRYGTSEARHALVLADCTATVLLAGDVALTPQRARTHARLDARYAFTACPGLRGDA